MKYFIYAAFSLLLLPGCKPGIPKDLIQPDEMSLMLHDIHLFEGYVTSITNIDTARSVAAGYYTAIYKKYHTDSAQYTRSLNYYVAHPKIMEQIYKDVTSKLKKEKDGIVRADSLENVKNAKTLRAKFVADSVRRADSVKVAAEKKKLDRQLDSLRKLQRSSKVKDLKGNNILEKRIDSLKKKKHADSLKNLPKKQAVIKKVKP